MNIKTKVVKVNTNTPIEIMQATTNTVIKTFSVVFRNNSEIRTINIYVKEDSTSEPGALIYNKTISKDGLYITDLYLTTNNILVIECPDYSSGDVIDVVLQYIELT